MAGGRTAALGCDVSMSKLQPAGMAANQSPSPIGRQPVNEAEVRGGAVVCRAWPFGKGGGWLFWSWAGTEHLKCQEGQ